MPYNLGIFAFSWIPLLWIPLLVLAVFLDVFNISDGQHEKALKKRGGFCSLVHRNRAISAIAIAIADPQNRNFGDRFKLCNATLRLQGVMEIASDCDFELRFPSRDFPFFLREF